MVNRLRLIDCVAIAAVAVASVALPPADDAAALLAGARQALGGDAALAAVTTWQVSGSVSRDLGPVTTDSALEISCVLPDKFVQVFQQTLSMGPMGPTQVTRTEGFNGDEHSRSRCMPNRSPRIRLMWSRPGPRR